MFRSTCGALGAESGLSGLGSKTLELGSKTPRKLEKTEQTVRSKSQKRRVFERWLEHARNRENAVFSSWALENTEKTRCFRTAFEKTEKAENTRKLGVFELGARMHSNPQKSERSKTRKN